MAEMMLMPKLGLTMERGLIVKWLKKEGEPIQKGDGIIEVESDKSTVEVDAQYSGTLLKILHQAGEEVACGTAIAAIGDQGEEVIISVGVKPEPELSGAGKVESRTDGTSPSENKERTTESTAGTGRIIASPRARRCAGQLGMDLSRITDGSGAGGRIEERDVRRYEQSTGRRNRKISPLAKRVAKLNKIDLTRIEGTGVGGRILREDLAKVPFQHGGKTGSVMDDQPERWEIPVSHLRARIGKRLGESVINAPHYYLSNSIDMEKILDAREDSKGSGDGVGLSITSILMKIIGFVLQSHPMLNSWWTDDRIILHKNADIAVAVSTEEGLLAPIVRACQAKSIRQIDSEMKELIQRAKLGTLQPADYQNPTFTVSNLGMYNIESFTAIINPPASAILALGKIMEKPLVRRGDVIVKPVMQATLSCDHRVIDGAVAAPFMNSLKETIENPLRTMLE